MNCDEATARLPWYLNGTLDEKERREVHDHLTGCERCRQALEDTRLAWRVFDQHVPAEALVALAWGETPEGLDPGVLDRHLQTCPQCAAELEMVRTSRRLEEDDRVIPFTKRPARSAAPWRTAALAAGLFGVFAASGWLWTASRAPDLGEPRMRGVEAHPPAVAPAPDDADRDRLAAMAAEVERLRQSAAEMRQKETEMREELARIADARPAAPTPQVNAWISDLRPTGDVVRGGAGEVRELPAGAAAGLMLQASHRETHRDHRIEIVDAAGTVVWSADGLRRNPETDDFSIILPGTLKPGAYTIRISAQEGGQRVDLESYAIRVR
jgi:hypothetical protein